MSKIGKINISIPEKVKVMLSGSDINIEGPLGKQSIKINLDVFDLKVNEGKDISIKPKKLDDTTKRLWGMNRSLINNAIIGSSVGFEKILLPGFDTLSKALITGLPEWYLSSNDKIGFFSSELTLKFFIKPSFLSISAIFVLKFDEGNSTFL